MAHLSFMVASYMGSKDANITDFMPSIEKEKKESKQSALLTKVKALFGGEA